jgi:hypothetical protein
MSVQYGREGVYIVFFCGPEGKQLVEISLSYPPTAKLDLGTFLDLMIPAISEASRLRALEKKEQRRKSERRI